MKKLRLHPCRLYYKTELARFQNKSAAREENESPKKTMEIKHFYPT